MCLSGLVVSLMSGFLMSGLVMRKNIDQGHADPPPSRIVGVESE
jgi:hypothetical protein